MLAFPFFAVTIWVLAARWRRQWQSFFCVGVGTALLIAIEYTLVRAGLVMENLIKPQQLLILLIPFTGMVFGVGIFISCLPKAPPTDHHCPKCLYDLKGLDPVNLCCPECGRLWTGKGSNSNEERHRVAEEAAIAEHEAAAASLAEAARRRRQEARAREDPQSASGGGP